MLALGASSSEYVVINLCKQQWMLPLSSLVFVCVFWVRHRSDAAFMALGVAVHPIR